MAPELRKRKSGLGPLKSTSATESTDKSTLRGKRKAAENDLPIPTKKQKPTKKAGTSQTMAGKSTSKSRKVEKKESEKQEEGVREAEGDVLQVGSGSESESEDEEDDIVNKLAASVDAGEEKPTDKALSFKSGQAVGSIPSVSKELMKTGPKPTGEPGVIYMGRIPHGFYEHEMRQYLSQFGPVTRVRLSRNKKTGASKHFAFVEFEESSTANIVAQTMDNYLLFGHILKCKTIPKEKVHENLFKGANKRFKKVPWNKMAGLKLQKPLSESTWKARVSKEKSRRAKQAEKFKAMGYDFDAPDLKDVPPPSDPAQDNDD